MDRFLGIEMILYHYCAMFDFGIDSELNLTWVVSIWIWTGSLEIGFNLLHNDVELNCHWHWIQVGNKNPSRLSKGSGKATTLVLPFSHYLGWWIILCNIPIMYHFSVLYITIIYVYVHICVTICNYKKNTIYLYPGIHTHTYIDIYIYTYIYY